MLNRNTMTEFISDRNNIVLVRFFKALNGLHKTDPQAQKPKCRSMSLKYIIDSYYRTI